MDLQRKRPSLCEEPQSHYDALHAAEAAVAHGDLTDARRLFHLAEKESASWESATHCRRRLDDVFPRWRKSALTYKAFSNVDIGVDHGAGRVWIAADMIDLSCGAARLIESGAFGDVVYEPVGFYEDGDYDYEVDHPRLIVYALTPFDARRRLNQICEFLIGLAKTGRINKDECLPRYRPGDSFLLRWVKT